MLRQLTLWEVIFIVALCVFAMSTARAALVCGNEDGVWRMGDSEDITVPADTGGTVYFMPSTIRTSINLWRWTR